MISDSSNKKKFIKATLTGMKNANKPRKPISAELDAEPTKGFDYSKAVNKIITINLDNEIVDYFKDLSAKYGKGYQVIIRDALQYFVDEQLEPQIVWKKKS